MNDNKFKITVKLSGESLALVVDREEEIIYRRAEQLLNEEFLYLAHRHKDVSRETLFTMLAYEVMVSYERGSRDNDRQEVANRLKALTNKIDDALKSTQKNNSDAKRHSKNTKP
ncbi:MAG: cell division protein ZapA [Bacteroidales bacterium]|nr:cell division protein ZapA [Bacteroidales bacterium]